MQTLVTSFRASPTAIRSWYTADVPRRVQQRGASPDPLRPSTRPCATAGPRAPRGRLGCTGGAPEIATIGKILGRSARSAMTVCMQQERSVALAGSMHRMAQSTSCTRTSHHHSRVSKSQPYATCWNCWDQSTSRNAATHTARTSQQGLLPAVLCVLGSQCWAPKRQDQIQKPWNSGFVS